MKKILYPLRVLWACWYFFIFSLIFLLFYPLFYWWLRNEKTYLLANNLRRVWAHLLFPLTGLFYSVKRIGKLEKNQTYIYCPNHFSYIDIPAMAFCIHGNFSFMAKMELGKIPLFNIFFRTVDISVNRSSMAESGRAFREASDRLDKGTSLIIFPEGKIGNHPPHLERFKSGAFRLAIEKQVPIVPITFADNWKLLYVGGKIYGRPGLMRTTVHAPIPTKNMTLDDVDALKEKVHAIIHQSLKEYESR